MHERQMVAEPVRLTYEDYCALPEDGRRYEILAGDLYMSPSPMTAHQVVVGNLFGILRAHVRAAKLGRVFVAPYDVVLGRHDVVEPDLIYVSKANESIITGSNIQGTPDLLIEVLSDSTRDRDLRDKRNLYARSGVAHYWLVDPTGPRAIELRLLGEAYANVAELSGGAVWQPSLFEGLSIPLPELIEA